MTGARKVRVSGESNSMIGGRSRDEWGYKRDLNLDLRRMAHCR
jgi:hypothetical protein